MMHIDDWLDISATYAGEVHAKLWFEQFRRPAMYQDIGWLRDNPLFCTFEGKRWRCIGASRLGDVWLTADFKRENGYDKRIDVTDCSEWSSTPC